jgi:starch-binding outer membrane protein, SusD/RagB family
MNKLRIYFRFLLPAMGLFFLSGCSDYFAVNPDDVLYEEDYPSSITELYSGYMGIAAKVQEVADQALLLEGIRGDFLEPTENAGSDIMDLYLYKESVSSELASPRGYYSVILNANDYLHHVETFVQNNPVSLEKETQEALVGGALRYKAWAYLMLAKLYGEAVWVDSPFAEYTSLDGYPLMDFDEVIAECIRMIEEGVEMNGEQINGKGKIRWSNVLFPGVGDSPANLQWNRICPDPEPLLAELYLFAGNYQQVVNLCLDIIRQGGTESSFQVNKSDWAGEWIDIFREFVRKEAVFMFTYDYNLKQTNRLVPYFSNLSPNDYLLRPSEASMDRFQKQIRIDGTMGDPSRGDGKTYALQNGQWVVNKFISAHGSADRVYREDVIINLYRAADIHLWLIEALGHLGRFEEALTLLNGGIESYFNTTEGVFMPPFEAYPNSMYRTSSSNEGANQGIRGRVLLGKVGEDILRNPSDEVSQDQKTLDLLIAEETLMESAGEAKSLFTLVRMARRWNDPAILADRVSAKYPEGTRSEMHAKLMNPDNWFISFDLDLNQ